MVTMYQRMQAEGEGFTRADQTADPEILERIEEDEKARS